MILWLLACGGPSYPDYWPDKFEYPQISKVSPSEIDGRIGGQILTIEGRRLSNATTVTLGGRNAEIVSVDNHAIQFRVPPLPAGPSDLAVGVVTGRGSATQEKAVEVATEVDEFSFGETVSVSMLRLDCPIEAWGTYDDGEEYPMSWCAADMGYSYAEGWMGAGPQPGFAGEISGLARLSELPPVGEVRVIGPKERNHPALPLVFNAHGEKEAIRFQTPRDFARDIDFLVERQDLLEATYYWADSITDWTLPYVTLYGDDECWLGDLDVIAGGGNELDVDGDASGATSLNMGFGIVEDYGDFVYEDWATTSSAQISADGGLVIGEPSGVEIKYDMGSGWFLAGSLFAGSDIPEAEFEVSTVDAKGQRMEHGSIPGPNYLDLWATWPDLTLGDVSIDVSEDLLVEWTPTPAADTPTIVAVEIAVYDSDVADPNGMTLVARLLAQGDDSTGQLVIPATELAKLPRAPNRWDEWDEMSGYWGDMSIVRHELRRVKMNPDVMVVDFVHVLNGPVRLSDGPTGD
jgi:hypothetical protein